MKNTLKRVLRSFQKSGFLRTLQRGLQQAIPASVFDINVVVGVETSLPAILEGWEEVPLNDTLHHYWATKEDTGHLTMGGISIDQVHAFFGQGGRAAISTKDGKPVGYFWLFPNSKKYQGWLRVNAGPDEILGGHIYVAPEFRGERWFRDVRRFVFPQLIDEGRERMLGFIEALNRSSLRAASSIERRNVGRIFYIRLFGLTLYRVGRNWGAGYWTDNSPFPFSFDAFGRRPS